jgi:hypothetical protein
MNTPMALDTEVNENLEEVTVAVVAVTVENTNNEQ